MSKCVCLRVGMFVCVYECMVYLSVCAYLSKCVGLCVYISMCLCLSKCVGLCVCECVYLSKCVGLCV